jgi:tetratricopeptide (TPR) repeat protein
VPLSGVERLLDQGRFVQAERETERLLGSGDLELEQVAEAYVQLSLAKFCLQDFFAGAKLAERALASPHATRDTIGMAHFLAGANYVEIGDTHLAIEHSQKFLEYIGVSERCKQREPVAHFNIAMALRQRREYAVAIGHYELAASIYTETGRLPRAMRCYREISWCYMVQDEPAAALPFLQRMEAWVSETGEPVFRNKLIVDKALYCLKCGDHAEAVALCQEIFVPGRDHLTEELLAEASWITGECAIATRRLEEAAIFADLAIDHALKAKWPFMMNRGNDLRRKVAAAKQQGDMVS